MVGMSPPSFRWSILEPREGVPSAPWWLATSAACLLSISAFIRKCFQPSRQLRSPVRTSLAPVALSSARVAWVQALQATPGRVGLFPLHGGSRVQAGTPPALRWVEPPSRAHRLPLCGWKWEGPSLRGWRRAQPLPPQPPLAQVRGSPREVVREGHCTCLARHLKASPRSWLSSPRPLATLVRVGHAAAATWCLGLLSSMYY